MLALSGAQLVGLLPTERIVAAVESAASLIASGAAVVPDRLHLHWDDNTLLAMCAMAGDIFGTKLVTIHPGNPSRALPATTGLMLLGDAPTGAPLALLEGGVLTARRTGAVGAMAVKHLTPADASSIGVIGCGVQGTWLAISACAVRPVRELFYVSRSESAAVRFRAALAQFVPNVRATPCASAEELLKKTAVVLTATNSSAPVLPDDPALLRDKHFFSVGSFRPAMQELPDSVFRLSGSIVVDSAAAAHEVGDVINPLRQGLVDPSNVLHIGQVVAGRRPPPGHATAFKSVGLAIYDLCVARALYEEARRLGVGQPIHL